jgi:enterochelin esterase family protein
MDSLLEQARKTGSPVVEDDRATFVFFGDQPPEVIGDFNGYGRGEPHVVLGEQEPGVWAQTVELPRDAYVEYLFRINGETGLDPLNPRRAGDGIGGRHNYFFMPEAEQTPLARARKGVPRGTVTRTVVKNDYLLIGGRRVVHLYRPPMDEALPLLVVFDGQDYLPRARIVHIVDNLIAEGRIRPIAMALVNHGNQARFIEYDCSDSTVSWLLRDIISLARSQGPLVDPASEPGAFGVLGASMGGLIALYTAMRAPQVFGRVISQSGALGLHGEMRPVVWELVRGFPSRLVKIWMDVGQYEPLKHSNREMHALLQEKGYDVTYREFAGGHNYTSWKNDVWRGLESVFPPRIY